MAFTAQDVKNLREQTGCGMMDCKKALTESNGDFEKAVEYLREKGLAAAQKKAGRIAAEGMVYATVCGKVGVVVEVNAETDFVAKNDMFQTFVKDVAGVVAEQNPADVDALLACKMGEDTVEAALKEKILVIGENIKIRRFERFEGICSAYIHAGGTHAVLVGFETSEEIAAKPEFEAYGKDIAMQIAAANPGYDHLGIFLRVTDLIPNQFNHFVSVGIGLITAATARQQPDCHGRCAAQRRHAFPQTFFHAHLSPSLYHTLCFFVAFFVAFFVIL